MKTAKGNMWDVYEQADLFLITTNSFIKRNGRLVMGAGIARQARDLFPGLDLALGKRIEHLGIYGLLISENFPQAKLGAFQVKYHFKDNADLDLIIKSTVMLALFAEHNDHLKIHLNYPGIGNGHLTKKDVSPIIRALPDNVTIWEYEDEPNRWDNPWGEEHVHDIGWLL